MKRLIFLLLPIFLITGCGVKMESTWTQKPLTIDGDLEDWTGDLMVTKGVKAGIGFKNNRDNLFIALQTSDLGLMRQIVFSGFTVWFDEKGGKRESFGIRYPLKDYRLNREQMARNGRLNQDDLLFAMEDYLDENFGLEIIGQGQFKKLSLGNNRGIAVRSGIKSGVLTYELRIPLNPRDGELGISIPQEGVLGIGFTTPEIERGQMKMDASSSGGGRQGRGGGMRGGMGRGMGGGPGKGNPGGGQRPSRPESIDIWAKVKLAKG